MRAASDAVDLTSIAPPADKNFRAAASTRKHPARRFIDARGSACPARRTLAFCAHQFWHCLAHRAGFLFDRSAPATTKRSPLRDARSRQSGRFLPRVEQAAQGHNLPRALSLWICGQGKSLAHNPTGPTADADNLNDLKISPVRTPPGFSKAALKTTRHGCYDLCRRL